jgi:ADP-ribose pyrophosphatase YjhB (NUDIX family)
VIEGQERIIPVKQAVMFLLYKDDKFRFEKRLRPDKSYYGHTIIPAGKVNTEKGEGVSEALEREIFEEHGVDIIDSAWLDTFEDITPRGNHYLVHAFLVTGFEGDVKENEPEKAELVWLSAEEAREEIRFVNSRHILALAQSYLNEAKQSKD